MRNSLESRLGIFFALTLLALVFVMELSSGVDFWNRGYAVHARFKNIHELREGDPVKMSGFQVGKVTDIHLEDGQVDVTMNIWHDYQIKTDGTATIHFVGLMGRNFVSLKYGSAAAPAVAPGGVIETVEQPDFGVLMTKLEGVADVVQDMTKNFSGDNFADLLAPMTDFINRNGPILDATFSNIESISGEISQGKGTVGRLIYEEDIYQTTMTTVSNLNSEVTLASNDLREVLEEARQVIDGIQQGQGTIGLLATDTTLYEDTAKAMTNLKEILEKINTGQGSIGQLVNDESLLQNIRMTIQKLERATDTLEDVGPMSVIGTVGGTLF